MQELQIGRFRVGGAGCGRLASGQFRSRHTVVLLHYASGKEFYEKRNYLQPKKIRLKRKSS
jgi:hypothetical protein